MILRAIPILMIVLPIIGFFYKPEPVPEHMDSGGRQMIADFAYMLFTMPIWAKIVSISAGLLWVNSWRKG